MGRHPNLQDLPRPGTRQAGLLQRINIEALEPRTLFSGGHDALRAQMDSFAPAGSQLNVQFEQNFAAAELHAPHFLRLAQSSQGANASDQQSPFATPAFGLFARFTESRGDDSSPGMQSLGFATLPAVEILYLRDGQSVVLGAVSAASGNGSQSSGADGTSGDVSTLIELALPAQGDAGQVSSSVLRKLAGGTSKDGADPDSSQVPAGTYVATLLGPNGKPIPVLMQGRPDQAQGQSAASGTGTNQAAPPAPSQTPSITPASVPANPAPNGAATPVTPLAMLPASHADGQAAVTERSTPKPLVVQTTPTANGASSTSAAVSAPVESAAANHPLGVLAVAVPTLLQVPQAVAVVSDAVQTAQGMVTVTGSVAQHASSLFSAILPSPSLPGTVAYSFIHLDAGGFNDAVTAFANELASLSTPTAAIHSSLRAWEITAAVIGVDAIFFAWWYRKSRREREEQRACLGHGLDPIPIPVQ